MSDRKHRNVVRSILNEPWLILPEKLEQIVEFMEFRLSGASLDQEVLTAEFGGLPRTESEEPAVENGVLVIPVIGTLAPRLNMMTRISGGTSTQQLAAKIEAAGQNSDVQTIVLRIDSPGGVYSSTPEVANVIREVAKTKRVVASSENAMASGAYWIGSAATEVYAAPSTAVGSVGAYSVFSNKKEAYEKEGVKFTVLRAGNLKAAGNEYEELTPERLGALKDQISAIYTQFVDAVADHRNVSATEVESTFGQGTTFLAEEAKTRGMIDGVATFSEVMSREHGRLGTDGAAIEQSYQVLEEKEMKVSTRVKAALFAHGWVAAADSSDEVCEAALNAALKAKGHEVSAMEDHDIITALSGEVNKVTDNVPEPVTEGHAEALATEERSRVRNILARAQNLPHVDQKMIDAAIESGKDANAVVIDWIDNAAKIETNEANIVAGEAQIDKMVEGFSEILLDRTVGGGDNETINTIGSSARHMSAQQMTDAILTQQGHRLSMNRDHNALAFLQLGGTQTRYLTSDGSANMRGDHPDLVSNLANKMLWKGYPIANVKYSEWCAKLEDLSDFKPRSFIDLGIFDELDLIHEDEPARQQKLDSNLKSWISADRYKNKVGLTVEMITDDDLGGFARQLMSLSQAAERTLNKNCMGLLASNPTMLDGNALFSAAHNNLITSGAVPSATSASLMRKTHRLQKGYSNQELDEPPTKALVPATLEEDALQTFRFLARDPKVANTDATINTVRGDITPIVDARLDGYSTAAWYTFVDPMVLPVIAYAFMRGYGSGGQRSTWFDNDRATRYVALEARFGAAVVGYRGAVKNPGA